MEITIEVPTGEVREVKHEEYYKDVFGWIGACVLLEGTSEEYPIYRREVIEVPKGATKFTGFFTYGPVSKGGYCCEILLPRPKVKKWKHTFNNYGITCFTEPITEEQAQCLRDETYLEIKKIPETEKEFEV